MTVKLSNGNGSETVVRLSMQSVIALSTVFVVAVMSGLFIWVNALSCQVSTHSADIAVLKQVDTSHKETLNTLVTTVERMDEKLDLIRGDQVRRQKQEKNR